MDGHQQTEAIKRGFNFAIQDCNFDRAFRIINANPDCFEFTDLQRLVTAERTYKEKGIYGK